MIARELSEILLQNPNAEVKLFAETDRWLPIREKGVSYNSFNNTIYIGF